MKFKVEYIGVWILFFLACSCGPKEVPNIQGTWIYRPIDNGSIIQPLKSFYPVNLLDDNESRDKIYIDSERIEHPLMRPKNDFSIQGKYTKYKLEGDKILLERDSIEYTYDFQISDGMICFNKGTFCLVREENSINKIDSTIFKFAVNQEFLPSFEFWMNYNYMSNGELCEIRYSGCQVEYPVDTIKLTEEEKTYIITMLERIPKDQLDRIYNNGLSDCWEISIDFYDGNGRWRGIETCDLTHENPFEIRVLTTNMFWILNRYLRKEK